MVVTALLGAGQLSPVVRVEVLFFVLLTSTILKSNYQLFCRTSFNLNVSDIFLLLDCGYEFLEKINRGEAPCVCLFLLRREHYRRLHQRPLKSPLADIGLHVISKESEKVTQYQHLL